LVWQLLHGGLKALYARGGRALPVAGHQRTTFFKK
jgi:hypothetical protein